MREVFAQIDGWDVLFVLSASAKKMLGFGQVETDGQVGPSGKPTVTDQSIDLEILEGRETVYKGPVYRLKVDDYVFKFVHPFGDVHWCVVQELVRLVANQQLIIFLRLVKNSGGVFTSVDMFTTEEMNKVLEEQGIHVKLGEATDSGRLRVSARMTRVTDIPVVDVDPPKT